MCCGALCCVVSHPALDACGRVVGVEMSSSLSCLSYGRMDSKSEGPTA